MSESGSSRNGSTNCTDDTDDFVMLDEPLNMAIRHVRAETKTSTGTPTSSEVQSSKTVPEPLATPQQLSAETSSEAKDEIDLQINPLKASNSFLVSINPPLRPASDIKHVASDIVLVIDVSGSMAELAPLPDVEDESERESSNLTVLDLVKHACRTIISTLGENDRLALITFSQEAKIIQRLTNMNEQAKGVVLNKIASLKDEGATNLWAGIRLGLEQFSRHSHIGNVQGLYVLTDGQPNYMCPQQGYVPKITPMLEDLVRQNGSAPTIQTFGFGYSIRSDLMLSIAKVGNGNYAFIPEVGMIGTVFVHAVANLYATYAIDAVLELDQQGASVRDLDHKSGLPTEHSTSGHLIIKLGSIIFGQSRDVLISHSPGRYASKDVLRAKLTYTPSGKASQTIRKSFKLSEPTSLPKQVLSYHLARDHFCQFLSTLYPVDPIKKHHITISLTDIKLVAPKFLSLVSDIALNPNAKSDPDLSSLLADLVGPGLNPKSPDEGQVYQALQSTPVTQGTRVFKSYWEKWGRHYLSSLWCAHMRQTCNSFKDPGPLRYGMNSDLFKKCRNELDKAFDDLPAPVGTYASRTRYHSGHRGTGSAVSFSYGLSGSNASVSTPVSMSRYNRSDNVCFLGSCLVTLAHGQAVNIEDLHVGMSIYNPLTGNTRQVAGIVKSSISKSQEICRIGERLWVTPWHPILDIATEKWIFPNQIACETRPMESHESVYSVLLSPSDAVIDHVIEVGGVPAVTLGHGLVEGDEQEDARFHSFFGNYERVVQQLGNLDVDEHGRSVNRRLVRDEQSGLVCGMVGTREERIVARL